MDNVCAEVPKSDGLHHLGLQKMQPYHEKIHNDHISWPTYMHIHWKYEAPMLIHIKTVPAPTREHSRPLECASTIARLAAKVQCNKECMYSKHKHASCHNIIWSIRFNQGNFQQTPIPCILWANFPSRAYLLSWAIIRSEGNYHFVAHTYGVYNNNHLYNNNHHNSHIKLRYWYRKRDVMFHARRFTQQHGLMPNTKPDHTVWQNNSTTWPWHCCPWPIRPCVPCSGLGNLTYRSLTETNWRVQTVRHDQWQSFTNFSIEMGCHNICFFLVSISFVHIWGEQRACPKVCFEAEWGETRLTL